MDPLKLGSSMTQIRTCAFVERVLRLLITLGWFCEPSQGYFANNRLNNLIKRIKLGTIFTVTFMLLIMLLYVPRSLRIVVLIPKLLGMIFTKVSVSFSEMINHVGIEFRKNADPHHLLSNSHPKPISQMVGLPTIHKLSNLASVSTNTVEPRTIKALSTIPWLTPLSHNGFLDIQ